VHTVQLRNDDCRVFYDKLTFIFLEMPKFNQSEDELQTDFDKWLYFLKNLEKFDEIPIRLRNRIFEKAFSIAEIARFNPNQIQAYEASLKYYRDLKNVIDTAFDEGIEQGIEKGTITVARNAIREGLPDELIMKLTGLDAETIRQLRESL
jgi:predicted transposase/invertase (TIGR01784 family)